jgi:hypothetical protein
VPIEYKDKDRLGALSRAVRFTGASGAGSMRTLGSQVVPVVISRAQMRGQGTDGKPHAAYSPAYKKARQADKRRTSPPDLTVTGDMFRAFQVLKVSADEVVIGIRAGAGGGGPGVGGRKRKKPVDPAVYGAFVNKLRPWIGLSPSDRRAMVLAFRAIMRRRLQGGR